MHRNFAEYNFCSVDVLLSWVKCTATTQVEWICLCMDTQENTLIKFTWWRSKRYCKSKFVNKKNGNGKNRNKVFELRKLVTLLKSQNFLCISSNIKPNVCIWYTRCSWKKHCYYKIRQLRFFANSVVHWKKQWKYFQIILIIMQKHSFEFFSQMKKNYLI